MVPHVLLHWFGHSDVPQLDLCTREDGDVVKGPWEEEEEEEEGEGASFLMCALVPIIESKSSDLALHVRRHQVVLVPHDVQGRDGRLLVEATGLPAVVSAASLPQVDAEDFPGAAPVEQHGDLDVQRDGRLARVFFPALVVH